MKWEINRAVDIYRSDGLLHLMRKAFKYMPIYTVNQYVDWKFYLIHGGGTKVLEEDWDNLIILDACRYDYFEEHNFIDGSLENRISRGIYSWEFMDENFVGKELHDTVYVTANPYSVRIPDGTFHATVDEPLTDGWDENIGTVSPATVTEMAISTHRRYPNKRLIIHYMQPHFPPIGKMRETFQQRVDAPLGLDPARGEKSSEEINDDGANFFENFEKEELCAAYQENLQIVLESVEQLVGEIGGLSVITSDHGQMLGERPHPFLSETYGHSVGTPSTPELRKVPWLVVNRSAPRREVASDPPDGSGSLREDIARERLRDLGYRE